MYAITGITGKVGGEVARHLLAVHLSVRAVVRDAKKGETWKERGCQVSVADMNDVAALTTAFSGTDAVFVLLPPTFDPSPGFPEAKATIAAIKAALLAANPGKVVCISTIGAQATRMNLLSQLGIMEKELGDLPLPITFLRPGWFVENSSWDVAAARENGVIPSFLQPLDQKFPMVATADVGRVAAELLQSHWTGQRVVELESAERISSNDIAAAFSELLGKPVRTEIVPRSTWHDLFTSQGMKNPKPRMRMIDGFNEGWIDFEAGQAGSIKGKVGLETVLKGLLA